MAAVPSVRGPNDGIHLFRLLNLDSHDRRTLRSNTSGEPYGDPSFLCKCLQEVRQLEGFAAPKNSRVVAFTAYR